MRVLFSSQPTSYVVPTVPKQNVNQFQDYFDVSRAGIKASGEWTTKPKSGIELNNLLNGNMRAIHELRKSVAGLHNVLSQLTQQMQPYENPNDIL